MANNYVEKLETKFKLSREGGGLERVAKQHESGKLTARERLEVLLDPGSFKENDLFVVHRCSEFGMNESSFLGDGVITGHGKINGRLVFVCSQDFTVYGGSLGEMHAKKITKIQDMALKCKAPIIFINDSGGARIQEGVNSLAGYGEIFRRNVEASGAIPQISIIMGPCAGGAVYSPALTDFTFMVQNSSYMYVTGPDVVKAVMHQNIDHEKLGGARVHSAKSGVCDLAFSNDIECLQEVRKLFDFLPLSHQAEPPIKPTRDPNSRIEMSLNNLVPDNPNKPYDMLVLIEKIVDESYFYQIKPDFAKNIIVGFARFEGRTVGIIANQPMHLAGCLDINASVKAARFIRFCDAFNIPILTLEDVPGFMPGMEQEHQGIIKHGAKLLYAYAEATVPKVTIIVRKAYGGAYIVMGSIHLGSDTVMAWPNAEIAVMGAKGAVSILYKRANLSAEQLEVKSKEYETNFASPYQAASQTYIDSIFRAHSTRPQVCNALRLLWNKKARKTHKKKHDNLPL